MNRREMVVIATGYGFDWIRLVSRIDELDDEQASILSILYIPILLSSFLIIQQQHSPLAPHSNVLRIRLYTYRHRLRKQTNYQGRAR